MFKINYLRLFLPFREVITRKNWFMTCQNLRFSKETLIRQIFYCFQVVHCTLAWNEWAKIKLFLWQIAFFSAVLIVTNIKPHLKKIVKSISIKCVPLNTENGTVSLYFWNDFLIWRVYESTIKTEMLYFCVEISYIGKHNCNIKV